MEISASSASTSNREADRLGHHARRMPRSPQRAAHKPLNAAPAHRLGGRPRLRPADAGQAANRGYPGSGPGRSSRSGPVPGQKHAAGSPPHLGAQFGDVRVVVAGVPGEALDDPAHGLRAKFGVVHLAQERRLAQRAQSCHPARMERFQQPQW